MMLVGQISLLLIIISCSVGIRVLSSDHSSSNWNGPPVFPTPYSANMRTLPAVRIDPSGAIYTTQILKQQLANELCVPLRDLRIVDPSFPSQIQATFASRPRGILFCIENIKVVVLNNEALIFSPFQPEVQEFIPALQVQLASNLESSDVLQPIRFEHIVLESALHFVCSNFNKRVRSLSPAVDSTLKGLRAESRGLDVVQTQVDELLPLKNNIDELRKRVKEIRRAITDILNNDEDMAMMYISQGVEIVPRSPSDDAAEYFDENSVSQAMVSKTSVPVDTMSLEMLFETYLNEIEWISADVEEIIDEITNTEENVVLQLDLLRNRILRFELTLSIASFVITCGALITGLFGMNLLSHLESNPYVFSIVTALMVAGMGSLFLSLKRYGRLQKLF